MEAVRNATRASPPAREPARHDQHPTKDTDPLLASTVADDMSANRRDVRPAELAAVAELLAAMPAPLAEIELRRQLCREAARDAYQRGYRDGYERGARVLEAEWPAVVAPVADGGPSHGELEARRWGPGGREHFGDPRPGDRFPKTRLEAAS